MKSAWILVVGLVAFSVVANADCMTVQGKITTMETATDCSSPVGLCTQGKITSGPLSGTTHYTVDEILGMAEADGDGAPATLMYSGTFILTAKDGSTLTFRDMGMLDQADAMDSGQASGFNGTGRLAGATGQLFFYGNATQAGFKENYAGTVCLPDGHHH